MTNTVNTRESSPEPVQQYTEDFVNVAGRTIYNTGGNQRGENAPGYNFMTPRIQLNFDNVNGRTVRNASEIPAPADGPEYDEEDPLAAFTHQPYPLQENTDPHEEPTSHHHQPANQPPTNGGARPLGSSSQVNIPQNRRSGPPPQRVRHEDDDEDKENRPPF